jgi:hypothetical protein
MPSSTDPRTCHAMLPFQHPQMGNSSQFSNHARAMPWRGTGSSSTRAAMHAHAAAKRADQSCAGPSMLQDCCTYIQ